MFMKQFQIWHTFKYNSTAFKYIKNQGFKYLLTSKINQEALVKLFNQLQSKESLQQLFN